MNDTPESDAPDSEESGPEIVEEGGVDDDVLARLQAARAETEAANWALWKGVIPFPLKHGALVGVAALTAVAAGFSWFEGGADDGQRRLNVLVQMGFAVVAFVLLAHFARRIVRSTIHDKPVPWGRDDDDLATIWQNTVDLAGVVVVLLAPVGLWVLADLMAGFDAIVHWPGVCILAVVAVVQFPLAVAAVVVRDDVVAAFPRTTLRMWRAEPAGARTAAIAAVVFLCLTIGSLYVALWFNAGLDSKDVVEDHTTVRDLARLGLFALRAAGLYAALVAFRVAGLLVRDVPKVREILR